VPLSLRYGNRKNTEHEAASCHQPTSHVANKGLRPLVDAATEQRSNRTTRLCGYPFPCATRLSEYSLAMLDCDVIAEITFIDHD
jgi:hypothetical protein